MEPHIAKLLEDVGAIKATVEGTDKKLDLHTTRLNSHSSRIDGLEETRSKQRGAAKLGAFIVAGASVVLGWMKWGGS